MRAPNNQFQAASKECGLNNTPLVAWPEDCGRYSWNDFPEITLESCVEKYDLIHIEPINENTDPVNTRPGRAYATTYIDDVLYLVTFEPREGAAQEKCADLDADLDLAYLEGYGSGEEQGHLRGWHTGYDARGLALAPLSAIGPYATKPQSIQPIEPEPFKVLLDPISVSPFRPDFWQSDDPVELPESSQFIPEDELPPVYDILDVTPIPDEELQQEEPEPEGPHGYGTPLPDIVFDAFNTTNSESDIGVDAWLQDPLDAGIVDPEPEEETEMSEVCSPCERIKWANKALEAAEIRIVTAAVLTPIAEALGGDATKVIADMDNLFAAAMEVYAKLSEVEYDYERTLLEAELAIIEADSLILQQDLEAKLEELSG